MLYVPDEAKLSHLVALPEGDNLGKAIDAAMKTIEAANPELRDVLPRGYQRIAKSTLSELLRLFAPLPRELSGDAFGLIYEYFLAKFAASEGQMGGEFFTPYSIVRLIVEIIEPFHGRIFDPACGSGGMFVQCAKFVERHQRLAGPRTLGLRPGAEGRHRSAGQDEPRGPRALGRHPPGQQLLRGPPRLRRPLRLRHGQSAVQRRQGRQGQARPATTRFPFGLPRADNGNYLWIQLFYAALNDTGRAGFVMANSAADAGHSETRDPPQADRGPAPST